MPRKVSISEIIRQGPREMKAQAPDLEFQFTPYNDGVMMEQIVDYFVVEPNGAPGQVTGLAMPCLQIDRSYNFWYVGLSRRDKQRAKKDAVRAQMKLDEEKRVAEIEDDAKEKLAWAIEKERGNGTHIGYGTHKPA